MKKRVTIYWLIPAQPERELFRKIIRILSKQFGTVAFEPHLTVCQAREQASAGKVLDELSANSITLRVRGIGKSSKFTKTLFVRFEPNSSLRELLVQLGGDPASLGDPHLSLLYQELPEKTRRELAVTIKLPFRNVGFDSIKAMSCVSPTETPKDVRSWGRLAGKRLSR